MKLNKVETALNTLSGVDLVECPCCAAQLPFSRTPVPPVDISGFESCATNAEPSSLASLTRLTINY
jgi:hypothetical protein